MLFHFNFSIHCSCFLFVCLRKQIPFEILVQSMGGTLGLVYAWPVLKKKLLHIRRVWVWSQQWESKWQNPQGKKGESASWTVSSFLLEIPVQAFLCPNPVGFCLIKKAVPILTGSREKCHVSLLGSRKPDHNREKREDVHVTQGIEGCLERG